MEGWAQRLFRGCPVRAARPTGAPRHPPGSCRALSGARRPAAARAVRYFHEDVVNKKREAK